MNFMKCMYNKAEIITETILFEKETITYWCAINHGAENGCHIVLVVLLIIVAHKVDVNRRNARIDAGQKQGSLAPNVSTVDLEILDRLIGEHVIAEIVIELTLILILVHGGGVPLGACVGEHKFGFIAPLNAANGLRPDEAQRDGEEHPAGEGGQQQLLALAKAIRIGAPKWSRQELDKGTHPDENAALSGIHAHLLEVDTHQREERAEGGIEEEIEALHRD